MGVNSSMSRIKNYMWDVGEYAVDNGIQAAMTKYMESEEGVKVCILFVSAYDGNWEQFMSEGNWQEPHVH